jgi:hypothetical protein
LQVAFRILWPSPLHIIGDTSRAGGRAGTSRTRTLVPEKLTRLATQDVVVLGDGRHGNDLAAEDASLDLIQHVPGDILGVPSRIHQNRLALGFRRAEVIEYHSHRFFRTASLSMGIARSWLQVRF